MLFILLQMVNSYKIKTSDFKDDLSNYFNITTGDTDDITEGANNKFLLQAERDKLGYVNIDLVRNTQYVGMQSRFKFRR